MYGSSNRYSPTVFFHPFSNDRPPPDCFWRGHLFGHIPLSSDHPLVVCKAALWHPKATSLLRYLRKVNLLSFLCPRVVCTGHHHLPLDPPLLRPGGTGPAIFPSGAALWNSLCMCLISFSSNLSLMVRRYSSMSSFEMPGPGGAPSDSGRGGEGGQPPDTWYYGASGGNCLDLPGCDLCACVPAFCGNNLGQF